MSEAALGLAPRSSVKARLLSSTLLILGLAAWQAQPALAEDLYWNNEGAPDDGTLETSAGQWNLSSANWTKNADDAPPPNMGVNAEVGNDVFENGDGAIFSATGSSVTVAEDLSPASITFLVDGYLIRSALNGQPDDDRFKIDVTTTLAIDVVDATHTGSISAPITSASDETIVVNGAVGSAGLVRLTGDLSGSLGTLNVKAGELNVLSGYGGTLDVDGGLVRASTGDIAGGAQVDGGTLSMNGATYGTAGVTVNGGAAELRADASTNVAVTGGSFGTFGTNTLTGNITQTGGTVSHFSTAIITGTSLIVDGTFTTEGQVNGTITLTPDVPGDAPQLVVNGGQITGLVTNNGGTIEANGGDFAGGITNNSGTVNVNEDVTANITNATTNGTVVIDATKTLSGNLTNTAGDATIAGIVSGNVTTGGSATEDVVDLTGQITGTLGVNGGQFNANAGSVGGAATLSAGVLNLNGATFTTGTLGQSGGTLNVNESTTLAVTKTGGAAEIDATKTLTGNYAENGGTTANNGILSGNLSVGGGAFTNSGQVTGTLGLTSGSFTANAASQVDGDVTVSGGTLTDLGGIYNANGITLTGGTVNLDLTTAVKVTNNGGNLVIVNGTNWTQNYAPVSGTTTNNGILTGDVTMGGTSLVADTFANNGSVTGKLDITGGTFSNNGGGSVGGRVDLTGGALVANGGTFTDDVTNNGGAVTIADDTTIATIFRNNSGTVTINSGQTLDGTYRQLGGNTVNNGTIDDAYFQSAGTFTQSGTGSINSTASVTGGTFDANGGTVVGQMTVNGGTLLAGGGTNFQDDIRAVTGTVTVDGAATGDLLNLGATASIAATGNLTGEATHSGGTLDIAGTLTGGLTVNTTGATVSGRVTGETRMNSGALTSNDGDFDQQVTIVDGDFTINGANFDNGLRLNGGTATVTAATTGDVTNAGGTMTQNALIDGDVVQSAGDWTQDGRISGTVNALAGTFAANARTNGQFTVNGATVTLDGANMSGGLRLNTGTVSVDGDSEGDVTAVGGTAAIAAGATMTGEWTNNGAATQNAGTLAGTVNLLDGTWTNVAGGDVSGQFNLKGGTLDANGGSFTGGIRATGGTLNLNADTTGDITNVGINVEVGPGLTLTGTLRNQSGNSGIRGTVDGDVTLVDGNLIQAASGATTGRMTVLGGAAEVRGGTVGNRIAASGGTLAITGSTTAGVTNSGATALLAAGTTLTGDLRNTGGTTLVSGTITDKIVSTGGLVRIDGTVNGDVRVNTGGRVIHRNSGAIDGVARVNGGRLDVRGGDFANTVDLNTGIVNSITNNSFDVNNSAGRLNIDSGTVLTGNVANLANAEMYLLGDLNGDLYNTGYVFAEGVVLGTLTNTGTYEDAGGGAPKLNAANARVPSSIAYTLTGPTTRLGSLLENTGLVEIDDQNATTGRLVNSGTISVSQGWVFASDTTADFQAGGTLQIDDGTFAAQSMDFARNNTVSLRNATLEGVITSASVFTGEGTNRIQSLTGGATTVDFTDNGGLDVQGGRFTINGDVTVGSRGRVNVADGASLRAGSLDSGAQILLGAGSTLTTTNGLTLDGGMTMRDGATVAGDVLARGNINGGDGFVFSGFVTNEAVIRGNGTLRFDGGLGGGGRTSVRDGATDDQIRISDELADQTFNLDIDLGDETGSTDQIVLTNGAVMTGDVVLAFNVLDDGGRQDDDLVVIRNAAGSNFEVTQTGLPTDGDIITYALATAANGDIVVADGLNPGIGALAGNIVLTQSLIGSVINRPSSPFVSGLAFEDEDPCGAGVWARGVGGFADSTGQVTQTGTDNRTFDGQITADYYGFQLGADWACFNGFYNGWDLAFGGIAGVNFGNSEQPVFALDLDADGGLSDRLTSVTNVEFQQTYAGVYVAAVRDRLAVDLQYRMEETEFTANNEGVGGNPGLGLNDETFKSSANTLSGAVSYAYPVEGTDFTIVPTAGFAWTQVETDTIRFGNRGVVEIDDFDSQTAFVGATVSRTRVGADGVSALNQFATATIYSDFADAPTSRFIPNDDSGIRSLETENLGTYGELSAGVNYVRILQPGEWGAVKQFNASVRGDIRYSDQLESWGVTAQARFQF